MLPKQSQLVVVVGSIQAFLFRHTVRTGHNFLPMASPQVLSFCP